MRHPGGAAAGPWRTDRSKGMHAVSRIRPVRKRLTLDAWLEERRAAPDVQPQLLLQRGPAEPLGEVPSSTFTVATYNVHRWTGVAGGRRWSPELALEVIAELDADVLALQEVLRPHDAEDPLERLVDELQMYAVVVTTRSHRRGQLGNAILSKWPISSVMTIDLSFGRLEKRSAVAAQFEAAPSFSVVATHLALVDRTRRYQVQSLLEHPELQGPTILLGDMNAWRQCRATRRLDSEFTIRHHNRDWPASFPATRPVLALDRIYARGAHVFAVRTHDTAAARRGSDHLPVVASVALQNRLADR